MLAAKDKGTCTDKVIANNQKHTIGSSISCRAQLGCRQTVIPYEELAPHFKGTEAQRKVKGGNQIMKYNKDPPTTFRSHTPFWNCTGL